MALIKTQQHLLLLLGEKIRKRREELGFSQQQLGDDCGLHRTYLSDVERGRRNLSINVLERIAGALHVPIAYFFL